MLTFDLHSLATLAAARALEIRGGSEGVEADQQCPIRRRLNLRRKCSWTPRHEPVRLYWLPVSQSCMFEMLVRAAEIYWLTSCFYLSATLQLNLNNLHNNY